MLYKPPHLTFIRLDFGITFKHGDKFGFGLERTLCSYSFPSEPSHGARVLGLGPFVGPVSACSDHSFVHAIACGDQRQISGAGWFDDPTQPKHRPRFGGDLPNEEGLCSNVVVILGGGSHGAGAGDAIHPCLSRLSPSGSGSGGARSHLHELRPSTLPPNFFPQGKVAEDRDRKLLPWQGRSLVPTPVFFRSSRMTYQRCSFCFFLFPFSFYFMSKIAYLQCIMKKGIKQIGEVPNGLWSKPNEVRERD
ncbi:hypothetical protein GW17_00050294 [Ensete ventricosum]|nr:hypothetical protein GW17_00050294 [Ensete ventricosum]